MPPSARHHANIDFGLAELGRLGGHNHVAKHRKLVAPAQREAAHGRDERLLEAADAVPLRELVAHQHVHRGCAGHLFNVGPGGERSLVPCDDDTARIVARLQVVEGVYHFVHQLHVEGVEHLGPIQLDNSDGAFVCQLD